MSERKKYTLGELVTYKKGFAFKSSLFGNEGDLVVRVSDTTDNSIDITNCFRIKKEVASKYDDYRIKYNDIIIATVGSWPDNPKSIVGKVVRVPLEADNALLNQNTVRLRAINEIHQLYLYYRLKSQDFSDYLISGAQGSANQASITLNDIFGFSIVLPSSNKILAINETLNSIDAKAKLLDEQNSVLEQLAETLFRQWFIEEATTDEEVILEEFVNTINGYSYKSSELNPSENALVTLKSFNRNGSFRLDGFKEFTGTIKQHQTVKQGDLIVSHTDITQEAEVIGNPALVIEDPRYKQLVITMDMVKVVPKDDRLSIPFLYFLMRTPEFKFHCLGCSNGTTVLHMSKSAIPTFSFPKPDFEKVKSFTEYAGNLLEKTFKNHAQICSLNNFRDTILPKLMSGEVSIINNTKR